MHVFFLFDDTAKYVSEYLSFHLCKDKDQEQFTKQLLYYLAGFAGGIPVSTLLHSLRYSSLLLENYKVILQKSLC